MFRAKTLLVLGAGASAELDMPAGPTLLKNVCELIDIKYDHSRMISGDYCISEALKSLIAEGTSVEEYNHHLYSAWQILSSSQQARSIDNIVHSLGDKRTERVAKLGIVRAIHLAEKKSCFEFQSDSNGSLDLSRFNGTWYREFTELLCTEVKKENCATIFENIRIVNFNYDRCLETYLPYSLSNYYGIELEEARTIVSKLEMYRPYGVAGLLPWQDGENQPKAKFGENSARTVAEISGSIKTFTEGIEDIEVLNSIRNAVSEAERIIFLGFAFWQQNMDILDPKDNTGVEVLGSAFMLSDNDRRVITNEIAEKFAVSFDEVKEKIVLENKKCHELVKDNWRTITSKTSHAFTDFSRPWNSAE